MSLMLLQNIRQNVQAMQATVDDKILLVVSIGSFREMQMAVPSRSRPADFLIVQSNFGIKHHNIQHCLWQKVCFELFSFLFLPVWLICF